MGDIALIWQNDGTADIGLENDDVAADEGLRTAVLLSLFTDRRADDGDRLPGDDDDRRGWWADEFAEVEGDLHGSRLWLLDRAARREDVPGLAVEYAREAFNWMIEDRIIERVDVVAETADNMLALQVTIYRPGRDPVTFRVMTGFRFAHAWDGEAARGNS